MSSVAAPKRHSKRKFKSKMWFFGRRSIGSSSSPSNTHANLPELFALLTTQQEANEDGRRCDVAGNATGPPFSRRLSNCELPATRQTTSAEKCKDRPSSAVSVKPPVWKECVLSASEVVENDASFVGEGQVIVGEKPDPEPLVESDAVTWKRREFLQEKGPAEVGVLPEVLRCHPSQSRLMPEGALRSWTGSRDSERCARTGTRSSTTRNSKTKRTNGAAHSSSRDGATPGSYVWLLPAIVDASTRWLVKADFVVPCAFFVQRFLRASAADSKEQEQEKRRMKHGCTHVVSRLVH